MEELLTLLKEILPEIDFEKEEKLIDKKVLNSLTLVTLITEIEDHYEIEIPMEYISPQHFNSVRAIYEMIEELK